MSTTAPASDSYQDLPLQCPHCGYAVESSARDCAFCGIDLALAASMSHAALVARGAIESQAAVTPEILVPRLGEILLERGSLTKAQLQAALQYHQQLAQSQKDRLFGQTLLELRLVDRETLDRVVTEQILQLQQALQESNRRLEQRVRQRTQDLQNALKRLAELNDLKSNFISNISHELRTPLTHLRGYLMLLSDGSMGELNTGQNEAIEVLLRAENRLEKLIEDLIQFSLTERGQLNLDMKPVNIVELLQSTARKSERLATARRVQMQVFSPARTAFIQADPSKISWVLLQLMDNAIKFTPQGGKVSLRADIEGRNVRFAIHDTGIGIPAHRLDEIFQPFHQLDSSDTREHSGTGLGLALVKKILEGHGTTIVVRSRQGEGSDFSFVLAVSTPNYG